MSAGPSGDIARPDRWLCAGAQVSLDRPFVVGILNVTPDSFSDGGRYLATPAAIERGLRLVAEGADLVDVGGESTRPGSLPVAVDEEWRRIGAVIEGLAGQGVRVSTDTTKAEVARRALDAGAVAINDVSGLRFEPDIANLAAAGGAGLIIMHMRGQPRTMQDDVEYGDLMGEIRAFLDGAIGVAVERGCRPEQLVVDPGIGFGKSVSGNLELIARVDELRGLGRPILVGPSRKSFIGEVLDQPVAGRLEGTLAACVVALARGARLFRVHDVAPARRALDMAEAILKVPAH